jgi:hypothetical protein
MKAFGILLGTMCASVFAISLAFANPAMLPKHPGYPAKGTSPATGQATANDQGQGNVVDSNGAAMSSDSASMNKVTDPNRERVKKSMGAGQLPQVEGPLNKVNINPAGATSTVIK